MKPSRNKRFSILPVCVALFAMPAWADIISATSNCASRTPETTPSSDFIALEGGAIVRHKVTGLEWRRCPEGMNWTGAGCGGTAATMTWQGALRQADNQAGWRLPNIKELRSIIEWCRVEPAINMQVFPDTPDSEFWSASPYAGNDEFAWPVNFAFVLSDSVQGKNGTFNVRLVRGGQ